MQLKIKDSFDVEDGLKEALLDMKSPGGIAFDGPKSIGNPEDFWEWMMTALVPQIYNSKQYNGDTMNPYEKNYIANFNRVIGGLFMLQHRRQRQNAGNKYSAFYPVEYTDVSTPRPPQLDFQGCH